MASPHHLTLPRPQLEEYFSVSMEAFLQRLFSTFASGWPGVGLLIQRLVTGTALVIQGLLLFKGTPAAGQTIPDIMGAGLGVFLLAGLWTPVAGALIAAVEAWIAVGGAANLWACILLAVLGATLAMIGPGAWSVDARLFGRKRIETPRD